MSYGDRRRMLTETFGSKKKQRAQATKDANAIDRATIYAAGVIQRQLRRDGEAVVADAVGKVAVDPGARPVAHARKRVCGCVCV